MEEENNEQLVTDPAADLTLERNESASRRPSAINTINQISNAKNTGMVTAHGLELADSEMSPDVVGHDMEGIHTKNISIQNTTGQMTAQLNIGTAGGRVE